MEKNFIELIPENKGKENNMNEEENIIIKPAKMKELTQVQELIKSGVKEGTLLSREKTELKKLIKQKNVFVAETNSQLVGIAILDFYSKRLSELRSLYVKPEYRSKGLGKALVEAVIEKAKKKKIHELMTITMKDKTNWFLKHGFSEETHNLKVALFRKM
jgi:N-acetylglutamate synthase-like GNAT family acetyltransferase